MARPRKTGVPAGVKPGAPARRLPAVPDDRSPLAWERQKGESAKAFWAFEYYRDLGPTRSLLKVQEHAIETKQCGPTMIPRWSMNLRWVERVEAWDVDQARRRAAESDRARADAARTRAIAGSMLMNVALRRLRGEPDRPPAAGGPIPALDPKELDVYGVVRSIELGAKIQMEALGDGLGLAGADPTIKRAVRSLVVASLEVALARMEEGMRQAVGANGNLQELIDRNGDTLVEEFEAIFVRATTR